MAPAQQRQPLSTLRGIMCVVALGCRPKRLTTPYGHTLFVILSLCLCGRAKEQSALRGSGYEPTMLQSWPYTTRKGAKRKTEQCQGVEKGWESLLHHGTCYDCCSVKDELLLSSIGCFSRARLICEQATRAAYRQRPSKNSRVIVPHF